MQEQLASNVAKVQQHEEHLEAAEARVWEWNGFVDRNFFLFFAWFWNINIFHKYTSTFLG